MRARPSFKRALTYSALAALSALAIAPGAVAQSGSVSTLSQRQSVNAQLTPTGEVQQARIYTQLLAEGEGVVDLSVPTSTRGLRNLEGFGKPAISGSGAEWTLALREGRPVTRRTVADFEQDLPIALDVRYDLDGQPVEPGDLVGRSGRLTVTTKIRNVSGAATEIVFKDGRGNRRTETAQVTIPLAGTYTTTLDERFSALDAPTAIQAGDGRGNTVLSWSLLLFEPVGSNELELVWSARVDDAEIPPATAQVVPVVAEGSPVDNGAASFADAGRSTTQLTTGALKIDQGVVRLANGAQQLLDGMTRLADGSAALADGLVAAADGSDALAAGTGKASDGGRKLAGGLGELADGAGTLSAGIGSARTGGGKLAGGLGELAQGAGDLSGGLGAAREGGTKLAGGLGDLTKGAGDLSGGLTSARSGGEQLAAGATTAQAGAASAAENAVKIQQGIKDLEKGLVALADAPDKLPALKDGIEQYRAEALGAIAAAIGTPGSSFPGGPSARSIVAQVRAGLPSAHEAVTGVSANLKASAAAAKKDGNDLAALADGQIATVNGAKQLLGCATEGSLSVAACGTLDTLLGANPPSLQITKGAGAQLAAKEGDLLMAAGILEAVGQGLSVTRSDGTPGAQGALAGLEQILAGVHTAVGTSDGAAQQGLDALQAGVDRVRDGVRTDAAGGASAIAGFQGQLADGLDTLAGDEALGAIAGGLGDLTKGLGQLDDGGRKLAAGAGAAAGGAGDLTKGLGQLDDGGRKLAAGAGAAAGGAGDLSQGLGQLDDGGRKLAAGAKTAAGGAGDLAKGLGDLDAGANKLATGLDNAAGGATTLSNGLTSAKIGGGNLARGADQLTGEGTSVLAGSVNDATAEQTRKVALLEAAAERARSDGLPFPAPDGATATAVYKLELAAADTTRSDQTTRVAVALVVLAAMGIGAALNRRAVRAIAG
jgi:putative membrane protein